MELIEQGLWPPDFKYTGYTGGKKGRRFGPAYFEIPLCISGEVKRRLEFTKTDGKLLKAQIQGGITEYELLEPEAQTALNFISLFDFRKRPKYFEWKKWRKYYYKTRDATKTAEQKLNNNMASGMWAKDNIAKGGINKTRQGTSPLPKGSKNKVKE